MKISGYILPFKPNSFSIPVYNDGSNNYYNHVLDENLRIRKFELITYELTNYISIGSDGSEFFISKLGAIVFHTNENVVFFGEVRKTLTQIKAYLSKYYGQKKYILDEIKCLQNRIDKTELKIGSVGEKQIENCNPIVVGLDIGTSKVVAIAGRKNRYGKLEILGFGSGRSGGVNQGMVLNIEECISSINDALDNCLASNPNLNIKEVYVGIAGLHIKSLQTRGDRILANIGEEIRKEDINNLFKDQYKVYIPSGDQIIDIIPQDFTVDTFGGYTLQQVIGMTGIKVGANFHIITADKSAIRNIHRSVKRAGLSTKDLVLQALASAAAVMCPEDFEAGVAIVDIGGGTTDLAVFHDGLLKGTAVIPIGGVNITNDIRQGLGVLRTQAEQMKVQFGMALASDVKSNAFITIPGLKGQPPKEISAVSLSKIIQARMGEILEYVIYHISKLNLINKLHGGIIFTGGGSQLKNLIQLAELRTGLAARIGLPNEYLANGHTTELLKPMYAVCIGLILRGYDDYESNRLKFISNNSEELIYDNLEPTGVFTTMTKSFEPSIEELLQNEFGVSNTIDSVKIGENKTNQYTLDNIVEIPTNLVKPYSELEQNEEINSKSKVKERTKLVSDVFSTVKTKVIYWFENVDDESLD